MLQVFICEDNNEQRENLEQVIENYLLKEKKNVDIKLVLSTGYPTDVIDYLEKHSNTRGIYFLDIDLQHEINGIELAAKIRKIDLWGTIVFITTHGELAHLTFEHKVEALDYIVKDQSELIESKIVECLQTGYTRYLDKAHSRRELYSVKSGEQIWNIPVDEILYFETDLTTRHRIVLQTIDSRISFRGYISSIAKESPSFYHCHKSIVVNVNNIKNIDTSLLNAKLINGDIVTVARQKMPELSARMKALQP